MPSPVNIQLIGPEVAIAWDDGAETYFTGEELRAAKPALGDDGRNLGGGFACPCPMRIHDHARQPRRQRQRAQAVAFRGDAAVSIKRT